MRAIDAHNQRVPASRPGVPASPSGHRSRTLAPGQAAWTAAMIASDACASDGAPATVLTMTTISPYASASTSAGYRSRRVA